MMSGIYKQIIEKCFSNLKDAYEKDVCFWECTCPPDTNFFHCEKKCQTNHHCGLCLDAILKPKSGNQKQSTYRCIPITYTYMLRFLNPYASEIFHIFERNENLRTKLSEGLVVSIGCGPATELVAINEICEKYVLPSFRYAGFDTNDTWKYVQNIVKESIETKNKKICFIPQELRFDQKILQRTKILIINYMISHMYSHEGTMQLKTWFNTVLTPLFTAMPVDSYIIINDVNSCNLGRTEIQEWAERYSDYSREYTYFIDSTCPQRKWDDFVNPQGYTKWDSLCFPKISELLPDLPNGIEHSLSCGSATVVIHKEIPF